MMRRKGRDGERGFVLITVLVIATLYFALIMLILWESSMRYQAAQRFRSRVIAQTLAENAAELAARGLATGSSGDIDEEISEGLMLAEIEVTGPMSNGDFHIRAAGRSSGVRQTEASGEVWGRVQNGRVMIERTKHGQVTGAPRGGGSSGKVPK